MRRERVEVPKPKSSFLLVQCQNCGNEQTVFSCTTIDIKCKICESLLAKRAGGKATISGVVLRILD